MVVTLQTEDDSQKTVDQCPRNVVPILKNVSNDVKLVKENKEDSQQKLSTQLHYRKVQPNTNSVRQIFVIYSKIHFVSLNKFHTLFLAFHLYQFALGDLTLKDIPPSYKTLCCMYIAMKYQEIYPIEMKELARYLKINCSQRDYVKYQLMILKALGMNLQVQTIDRLLQSYFLKYKLSKTEELLCFYLLELTFVSPKIFSQYSESDICQAILKLVTKKKALDNDSEEIKSLMRLIVKNRTNYKELQKHISHKYQSKRYDSVAFLPIAL